MRRGFREVLVPAALVALALASVVLAGCGAKTAAPLTEQQLENAQYQGIYSEPVQLTDGKYEGPPFVEGGASRPTVTYLGIYATGDLNGDGSVDAVDVVAESSGGSGTFIYLAAFLNQGGKPDNVATTSLGDRVQVKSLSIAGGEITVAGLTFGPNDPMCCPSQEFTTKFKLQGSQLVESGS
jgi:hypothetical protein